MQEGRWEGHCKGHLCYMYKNPESTPIGTTFFTAVADHSPCTIPHCGTPFPHLLLQSLWKVFQNSCYESAS